MNPLRSFTLRPSGAFSAYDDASKENQHSVIFGTIRQDFERPRPIVNPEVGLGIRASPFEPLVQDRNLPKSGTISPLKSEEYKAWIRSREDMHTRSSHNPLAEQCYRVSGNGDNESSLMLRYLQSEMSRTQMRMNMLALMEEKRQMRIKILGLEAALHLERSEDEESKHLKKSPESISEKNPSINCDISNESETLKHVNATRGGRASKSLDSRESLPDEFQLHSSSKRLSSCLNTTTNTADSDALEGDGIDTAAENENPNRSVNQAVSRSSIEAYADVVIDTSQTNPPESHEPPLSMPMTRSHHRRKDAEHKVHDASPKKLETLVEKETARVSLYHINVATNKSEDDSNLIDAKKTVLPDYSAGGQSEAKTSLTMEMGKRKRNIKANLVSSFQAPPLKKQTRRRTNPKR